MKNRNAFIYLSLLSAAFMALQSFKKIPNGVEAVKNFDQQKYLGKWYEIARLDYKWEKNLDHVTATYSLNDNGFIKVDNKGYNFKKGKWEESIGKAKAVKEPTEARLKVSFFGPFYAGYNVVAIDKDYQYALVIGSSIKYMWILSREKSIPEEIKVKYINKAKAIGVKTEELIWVNQK